MKFCKDCKHCANSDYNTINNATCYAPVYRNPINGNALKLLCDTARRVELEHFSTWGFQPCGPDAQYFEAKL